MSLDKLITFVWALRHSMENHSVSYQACERDVFPAVVFLLRKVRRRETTAENMSSQAISFLKLLLKSIDIFLVDRCWLGIIFDLRNLHDTKK